MKNKMENKIILNALQRVHSEKEQEAKKAIRRMGELSHQIMHYNYMKEIFQEQVLKSLFEDMKSFGWNDWVKKLKGELKKNN